MYSLSDKSTFSCIRSSTFPTLHKKFGKNRGSSNTTDKPSHSEGVKQDNGQHQITDDVTESPNGAPGDVGLEFPVILVGNKVDEANLSRAVSTEEGEKLREELCCAGFFETSATCNENIVKAFNLLIQEIIKLNEKLENTPQKKSTGKSLKACCVIV